MAERMKPIWEEIDHDPTSNRRIFKTDDLVEQSGHYGTYDFKAEATFEVRNADGEVLLRTFGSARGEYWCGVFLWFVKGSEGQQVLLDESDNKVDRIIEVPDLPIRTPNTGI